MRIKWLEKKDISKLLEKSGVYFFKKAREILYIGKARNLRKRVKDHFENPGFKEKFFLGKTEKIGFLKTDSEIEALVLEAKLIKKYQPKHNIVWRDDKNYFFVAKTKEDFPRIFISHQPKTKKGEKIEYLGPFVDGRALKQSLKILRKIFPYRSCQKIPKRPCLWYQLQRCPAPCLFYRSKIVLSQEREILKKIKKISQENAKNIFKILKGERGLVLKKLEKEMKQYASSEQFEKAGRLRDQITALEKVLFHARVFEETEERPAYENTERKLREVLKSKKPILRIEGYDISCIQGKEAVGAMVAFIRGKSIKSLFRRFKIKTIKKANDPAMIKECLVRRFNHPEWGLPDLVLIDGGKGQLSAALEVKKRMGLGESVKFASLAKKENRLYLEKEKKPFLLKDFPSDLSNLILKIRDQAHRFSLNYHRKIREKKLMKNSKV